jgi:hypothetical protein
MTTNEKRKVHPLLVRAYREAIYIVNEGEESISLRVGEVNHELAKLMRLRKAQTAAVLTAYNPYSQLKSLEENESSQAKLINALSLKSIAFINAIGTDSKGEWDSEPSVLALGISLQDAEILADEYGQNAFIWVNNADSFISLRLRFDIGLPSENEIIEWIETLSATLKDYALSLPLHDLALILSTPIHEQEHWLNPNGWDLNKAWPLARPDGTAMGVGTEMDRMFKLIAAGIQRIY